VIWLDAYAIVAMLGREPAVDRIRQIFNSEPVAITAINLAEAVDVLVRVHAQALGPIRGDVRNLAAAGLDVVGVTAPHAWRAAELRSRYYRRQTRALSLADCVLLAAAEPGDGVATADPAVAAVARLESIRLVALPDSGGRMP